MKLLKTIFKKQILFVKILRYIKSEGVPFLESNLYSLCKDGIYIECDYSGIISRLLRVKIGENKFNIDRHFFILWKIDAKYKHSLIKYSELKQIYDLLTK